MLINLELLRTFLAAAGASSFREASAQRHVTKSAVSQQIKLLEGQLGVSLFERVGRQARLTHAGRALAEAVGTHLEQIDLALDVAVSEQHDVRGEMRLGAPGPFTRLWLRPRIVRLLETHDALRVTVSFGTPAELEQRLADRELDLVILVRPVELPTIEATPIFTETFRLYAAPRYLKARGTPASVGDLQRHRFIGYGDELPMHAPWWRAKVGAATPFRGTIVCRVANLYEMLALAEEGIGLVVLPDYFTGESVRRRALVEVPRVRGERATPAKNDILLAWRKSAVATASFRAVRDALRA